ncbi:uncharacterized protein [Lepeophtheirus salmonis]|uniref:uncharacterized protein n=1 Tax=Lepeophtheirus salmonis TaxID=72036 RepID=UPI003AF35FD1
MAVKKYSKNKQKEEHWFGAYKAGVETDSSFHWIDLEPSLGGYVNWDSSNRNNMTSYGAFNGTSGKWRLISDDTQLRSFCVVLEKLYQHHLQNPQQQRPLLLLIPVTTIQIQNYILEGLPGS